MSDTDSKMQAQDLDGLVTNPCASRSLLFLSNLVKGAAVMSGGPPVPLGGVVDGRERSLGQPDRTSLPLPRHPSSRHRALRLPLRRSALPLRRHTPQYLAAVEAHLQAHRRGRERELGHPLPVAGGGS